MCRFQIEVTTVAFLVLLPPKMECHVNTMDCRVLVRSSLPVIGVVVVHSARNHFAARSMPGLLENIDIAKMGAAKYVGAVRRALDSVNDVAE